MVVVKLISMDFSELTTSNHFKFLTAFERTSQFFSMLQSGETTEIVVVHSLNFLQNNRKSFFDLAQTQCVL